MSTTSPYFSRLVNPQMYQGVGGANPESLSHQDNAMASATSGVSTMCMRPTNSVTPHVSSIKPASTSSSTIKPTTESPYFSNTSSATNTPSRPSFSTLRLKFGEARRQEATRLSVCHVCGSSEHRAGFVGTVYRDCTDMPCYLCKVKGHTTTTCPHTLAPRQSNIGTNIITSISSSPPRHQSLLFSRPLLLHARETGTLTRRRLDASLLGPKTPSQWGLDAGVFRLHSRRVTALTYVINSNNNAIVCSGDKGGELAVWRQGEKTSDVSTRDVWTGASWTITSLSRIESSSMIWSSSSDGTVRRWDLKRMRENSPRLILNDREWIPGGDERTWRAAYSVKSWGGGEDCALVGDSTGRLLLVDARLPRSLVGAMRVARLGSRVLSIDVHTKDSALIATGGNDHFVRLWDLRRSNFSVSESAATSPTGTQPLSMILHPRVVTSARFSPITGSRLVSTCANNRLYIYDNVGALACTQNNTGVPSEASSTATREIVHSHDSARFISPFRAEWSSDVRERTIVIGRYISESRRTIGGVSIAIHPVDLLDVGKRGGAIRGGGGGGGSIVSPVITTLAHPLVETISPVIATHPFKNTIAVGTSSGVFIWRGENEGAREIDKRAKQVSSVRLWAEREGDDDNGEGDKEGDDDVSIMGKKRERDDDMARGTESSSTSTTHQAIVNEEMAMLGATPTTSTRQGKKGKKATDKSPFF